MLINAGDRWKELENIASNKTNKTKTNHFDSQHGQRGERYQCFFFDY